MAKLSVEVEASYSGGLIPSSRKFLQPITTMVSILGGHIRHRVRDKKTLADGRKTGRYARIKQREDELRKRYAISKAKANKDPGFERMTRWRRVAMLEMLARHREQGKKQRRNYKKTGGMWKGLKAKAQKAGHVTLAFYGRSASKGVDPKWEAKKRRAIEKGKKIPYGTRYTLPNREKAWHTSLVGTDRKQGKLIGIRHREGIHILAASKNEIAQMGKEYGAFMVPSMMRQVVTKQKAARIMEGKIRGLGDSDPELKKSLKKALSKLRKM